MTQRRLLLYILSLCLLTMNFLSFQFGPVYADTVLSRENILIVHSYNHGFAWTDELNRGITDNLPHASYNIYTEYLDAYRVTPIDENKIETIKSYSNKNISYIVVTDNDAYDLLITLQKEYFEEIPILFAGVNGGVESAGNIKNVTGILQNIDYESFLKWLNIAMPDVQNLLVCGADTNTTSGTFRQMTDAYLKIGVDNLRFKLIFVQIENYSKQIETIKSYHPDVTAIYSSGSFGVLDHEQYTDMLSRNSGMPTFCGVSTSITNEVIGGYVVSPYEHGDILGKEIIKLSEGASIDSLPVIEHPVQKLIFNYKGLQKFGISETILPKYNIIINRPDNSILFTFNQVIIFGALFFLSVTISAALVIITFFKRRAHRELVIVNSKVTNLLEYDQLTGLMNENKFYPQFLEKFAENQTVSLINITITNLNNLKFTHGKSVYESILISIATFLQEIVTSDDLVAISGNNDFLIAVPNIVDEETALIKEINHFFDAPLLSDLFTIILLHKVGIAYYPVQATSYQELLHISSLAITTIIDDSIQNVAIYDACITENLNREMIIINEIESALFEKEFMLYYQPKYKMDGITITGLEALIRWNHKDGTIKAPAYFIDIAEQSGQIINIGFYVIEEACKAIFENHLEEKNIPIAINLSGHHFASHEIIRHLADAIAKYHISASMLELEITETSLIKNREFSSNILKELRKMGFVITLDDFGTGYASINYVKDLPIDKLKIDKSFTDDLKDIKKQNLLKSMIQMANELSYEVTLEGIETQEQYEIVKKYKLNELQGYLFKRPAPFWELFP